MLERRRNPSPLKGGEDVNFTYAGALFVPRIAKLAPISTGVVLACVFIAIRVKRRRLKKAR